MKIIIKNSSDEPIYKQIFEQIRDEILQGNLKAGMQLPSIRELAKELGVSVITTKRSYQDLENGGFIESATGRGSFVSGYNKELLKETRLMEIEEALIKAVKSGKSINLSLQEIKEMIEILYNEP